ncbi:MAG: 4-hydroxythreonine-4-phosphate dehydrogenase PdxA, partial [Pseudomonadota bacterium]|nr:4-hydroxythreonine-4-phosphate dehydrogenase PdxA [Pseudomonadota bacterium]
VGALPADSVFHAASQGKYDAVLAMYHDQGLAPLKTLAFHDAFNLTTGLPILRLSPDHGTASDLFRKRTAVADSMNNCVNFIDKYFCEE